MHQEDAKTALERRDREYHASHAARARKSLDKLDAAGKRLKPSDMRRCEEYSIEVLGHEKFAPWLMVYTAFSGRFKEGWIPDNFYGAKVVPMIQGRHGQISFLKSLSGALFNSTSFPNIGSRINGAIFDSAYQPLSFEEAHEQFFQGTETIVFKPDQSGRGKGIHFFGVQSFDRSAIDRLGNGVFQRRVTQHPLFDRFSTTAVATVRLTTVVEASGEISVRAGYLSLGTGSDTHVQIDSLVGVPLDIVTGELSERGLQVSWAECSAHPTSGELFAGTKIPAFDQCLRTAIVHHQRVPFVRCVGWDVAVDSNDQVQILEWNGFHNAINLAEAAQGPCFTGLGWERFA
jgi:hypothetical protein